MKHKITTISNKYPADLHTPVGIYLRLRDAYRETILLESSDHQNPNSSKSIIAINPIAGIEIMDLEKGERKFPLQQPEKFGIEKEPQELLEDFRQKLLPENPLPQNDIAQSLFGYVAYDMVQFFEDVKFKAQPDMPLLRFRLYQYVIVIDHYTDEMYLFENKMEGLKSEVHKVKSFIQNRNIPLYPFKITTDEKSNMTDTDFENLVKKGMAHGKRGDTFQVVMSRRYEVGYQGDEFQVYRALRNINPSPYLYYFDYSDYKIFGSSPESQMIVQDKKAKIHPIAGTFCRTGDDEKDMQLAQQLKQDEKENAEHTMLVDLARNDLSKCCTNVHVSKLKEIQFFSHVIHMVSEVEGDVTKTPNPFEIIASTFPQGTLSGAPKHRALQIIDENEPTPRGYYGGSIGLVGLNGNINQAIMIRSFYARQNTLYYQAGAGVVVKSNPQNERQEVLNKLGALTKAIEVAENYI